MLIGCPREIKNREYRVGLTPESARELVRHGHEVWIESGAGLGIGVLIGMNMATRQGPDPGERSTLALDQRQVQRLVHQGQHHHIDTDQDRRMLLFSLIHFFTK